MPPQLERPLSRGLRCWGPQPTPPEYSAEFRAAVNKLEAMGVHQSDFSFSTYCTAYFQKSKVRRRQELEESTGDIHSGLGKFRSLLALRVPAVAQLSIARDKAALVDLWRETPRVKAQNRGDVWAEISSLDASSGVLEMAAVLALTPMSELDLELDCKDLLANRSHDAVNAGSLLSALVCRRSLCRLERNGSPSRSSWAECGELRLSCQSVADNVLAAACSAVAEVGPSTHLSRLSMESTNPARWAWLIYALNCRASNVNADHAVPILKIRVRSFTNADLSAIEAVLETGYPLATSNGTGRVYGFVDIAEGTRLWPRGFMANDDDALIALTQLRCRASYNPATGEVLDFVVPGYGVCTTRRGDSIDFTPGPAKFHRNQKRMCNALDLYFDSIGDVGLVMDVLKLLFGGIRELTIHVNFDSDSQPVVDLTVLAIACPLLEELKTTLCTVIVSSHNKALERLPLRKIRLWETNTVSGLLSCLRDPTLRMARELMEIVVSAPGGQELEQDEERALEALDGEVLPVTEEKFPTQSKAALLSIVMRDTTIKNYSTAGSKAIHHVDANILSLIFVFASTAAQRVTCCY